MLVTILKFIEGAGGTRLTPGTVADASDWRNADSLLGSGYLRLATPEEDKTYRAHERAAKEKDKAHA